MPSETEDAARQDEVAETLQRVFGYDAFRPVSARSSPRCSAGRDAFALLPTGGGKSLTYQLPAAAPARDHRRRLAADRPDAGSGRAA